MGIDEDDWSKAVFGLDFGTQNMVYGTNFKDNFVAKLNVGVPFNVYSKKKTTK